jgi:glucose dehydrogenase
MTFRAAVFMAAIAATLAPQQSRAADAVGWVTNGGDLRNDRYAPLPQITPDTIKTLGGAWRTELPGASSKASPIVADGVM